MLTESDCLDFSCVFILCKTSRKWIAVSLKTSCFYSAVSRLDAPKSAVEWKKYYWMLVWFYNKSWNTRLIKLIKISLRLFSYCRYKNLSWKTKFVLFFLLLWLGAIKKSRRATNSPQATLWTPSQKLNGPFLCRAGRGGLCHVLLHLWPLGGQAAVPGGVLCDGQVQR